MTTAESAAFQPADILTTPITPSHWLLTPGTQLHTSKLNHHDQCIFHSPKHMEIRLNPFQQLQPLPRGPLYPSVKRFFDARKLAIVCRGLVAETPVEIDGNSGRRWAKKSLVAAAVLCISDIAGAVSTSRRALRSAKIPESEFTAIPNGLKYYDLKVGGGAQDKKGARVALHYVAKEMYSTFGKSLHRNRRQAGNKLCR